MKTLVFFNKNNGVIESTKSVSKDIIAASFSKCKDCADFIPSLDIQTPIEGYEFISGVSKEVDADLIIFTDETLIRESAAYFAGKEQLGLISHSTRIYTKDDKIIGLVPGWENLEAEVYATSRPALMILKSNESVEYRSKSEPKIIEVRRSDDVHLIERSKKETNPLQNARIVIGIGRGVKKSQISKVKHLAKELNAEIGCTRPVADMGLLPLNRVIGDSGISISPEIYIALGISGAIQHLSGVNAKYVIAINSDPSAPIFAKCTLPINAKVEDALPEIEQWIRNTSR